MNHSSRNIRLSTLVVAFGMALACAAISRAQGTSPNLQPAKDQQQEQERELKDRQMGQTAPPKIDPQEEAAYKAFFNASAQDPDTKIQLGEAFVQKYPSSKYDESVYSGLTQAYFAKQDWKNFYASADKAIALNPDDVTVLVTVGWVIPHAYDANDPDAAKKLDKAEQYEKHTIELTGTLPKPATMTDGQFAESKATVLTEAHSGLGLIYFRKQDAENSVKELQQATQGSAPDPTDLYVLGLDLQTLNRNAEAADAFNRCAQIQSGLQQNCKQSADAAKKAATPK